MFFLLTLLLTFVKLFKYPFKKYLTLEINCKCKTVTNISVQYDIKYERKKIKLPQVAKISTISTVILSKIFIDFKIQL